MYGGILRQLRESRGRSQADVAKAVSISPAHLARLETGQRGLYVEDFVSIAEALGEKPGNLLPNSVGTIAHVKPLIDRLALIRPELLPYVTAILTKVVLLAETVVVAESVVAAAASARPSRPRMRPASPRKGRR